MCRCTPEIRTPCCGKAQCHPSLPCPWCSAVTTKPVTIQGQPHPLVAVCDGCNQMLGSERWVLGVTAPSGAKHLGGSYCTKCMAVLLGIGPLRFPPEAVAEVYEARLRASQGTVDPYDPFVACAIRTLQADEEHNDFMLWRAADDARRALGVKNLKELRELPTRSPVRAARLWKALAKKLWRSPVTNRGGLSRYVCAAKDVRMKAHGR